MQKILYLFFFIFIIALRSNADDCTNGRYLNPIFQRVDVTKNIIYARKKQSDGQYIDLKYDVYQPNGDTLPERPVMLLIHGGAYLKLLDQNSPDIVLLCEYFAKRGYVCVSIDYRQESNLLGLLSEETMVKAVSRALIDTKEAVDHLVRTYQSGNPYRLDTTKAIIGGVSAGAVSTMFISFLDSIQMLPTQYQQWVIDANGPESDSILRHKFDFIKPKIAISISGAVLDTAWIQPKGIDLLLVHGSADEIVPYKYDHPFHIPMLPKLYGGKLQYPVAVQKGIRCEFEDWIGKGHVPFFNLDLGSILTLNLINYTLLDSTERHIANFCYKLFDCDSRTTSVKQNLIATPLDLFPNPSSGRFYVTLPKETKADKWMMEVYDYAGTIQYNNIFPGNSGVVSVERSLPAGMYFIKLWSERNNEAEVYTGKILITR